MSQADHIEGLSKPVFFYALHVARSKTRSSEGKRHLRQSEIGVRKRGLCGVCGADGLRTKTHVPPQAAGNRADLAMRRSWTSVDHRLVRGSRRSGGIWLYGLCSRCNGVAGRFDPEYARFASIVEPAVPHRLQTLKGFRWTPSSTATIRAGAVARCVLSGMFALNPSLRTVHPAVAKMLETQTGPAAVLPEPVQLRLAVFNGAEAEVSGAYGAWYLRLQEGQRSFGFHTAATIYFPPFAWQLSFRDMPEHTETTLFESLLNAEGWADASAWTAIEPSKEMALGELLAGGLPLTCLPISNPTDGWRWSRILSDQICPIISADLADWPGINPT